MEMGFQNKDEGQPRTAEYYRKYKQQLVSQGPPKKKHSTSTKNNIKGIKIRWKKLGLPPRPPLNGQNSNPDADTANS